SRPVPIPDPYGLAHIIRKDFALTNLPCPGGLAQLVQHYVRPLGRDHHLDLHFGQQVYVILLSSVRFSCGLSARHGLLPRFIVMPSMPIACNAVLTSSSSNGRLIAWT